MRAIMVMFDSLNRNMLPPYGSDWTVAPNFQRLAERTVAFDNCYGGSMPCMPARRELHTGRYNFLHRSWGPLEPFDDSMPQLLKQNQIYTHLATDHPHYWEDGGATYHTRYSSFEFFRGQEGDAWKGHVADPVVPDAITGTKALKSNLWRQDWVNRQYLADKADHPQTMTFDAGCEFIITNRREDDWFLQIETFDPHEPYYSYAEYKRHYDDTYAGPHFDWPDYVRTTESDELVDHARLEYAALLTMCDESLGRVLDLMDENDMWQDTMLIVNTDHGFLLGEHGWWGKNVQPWYDETIHIPLFIWDPRTETRHERRSALVQSIDLAPTLLDFFGIGATVDMQGRALGAVIKKDEAIREAALFGMSGGHVCVTDGRYVYMRAPSDQQNQPLFEYTLMPTFITGFFPPQMLQHAELVEGFDFTKGARILKVPTTSYLAPWNYGTLLYDLQTDPLQGSPLRDDALELRMATLLRDLMVDNDSPAEQFERLGLPAEGPISAEHLQVAAHWPQVLASTQPPLRAEDFPASRLNLTTPLSDLVADDGARAVLEDLLPMVVHGPMAGAAGALSILQIAASIPGVLDTPTLHLLAARLAALG